MNHPFLALSRSLARLVAGAALFSVPAFLFLQDARSGTGVVEGAYVETAQVGTLLLSGLLLLAAARRSARHGDEFATALLFTALGVGCMVIRELDGFFDLFLFHGSWKVFALPFAMGVLALVVRRPRHLASSLAALLESRAGILLELFALTLLVFSRTFGLKVLWKTLFSQLQSGLLLTEEQIPYVARAAKNAMEEVTELFAYMELLAASLCALFQRRNRMAG